MKIFPCPIDVFCSEHFANHKKKGDPRPNANWSVQIGKETVHLWINEIYLFQNQRGLSRCLV
jgi:hypothetical protein